MLQSLSSQIGEWFRKQHICCNVVEVLVFDGCRCSVLLLVGFLLVIVAPEVFVGCCLRVEWEGEKVEAVENWKENVGSFSFGICFGRRTSWWQMMLLAEKKGLSFLLFGIFSTVEKFFFTPTSCLWSKLMETLEEFVRANLLSSASLDSEAPHYFGYTTCTAKHLCGTLL